MIRMASLGFMRPLMGVWGDGSLGMPAWRWDVGGDRPEGPEHLSLGVWGCVTMNTRQGDSSLSSSMSKNVILIMELLQLSRTGLMSI